MAAPSWMEQSVNVGDGLSLLVLLDSEVGFVACFRNRCASGTLTAAVDGAVGIAQLRQRARAVHLSCNSGQAEESRR